MEQKDLGIWITSDMNFSLHCQNISNKANQTLGRLRSTCLPDPLQPFTKHLFVHTWNTVSQSGIPTLQEILTP